uniref:Pherophorin domain-containing protein n=1 Tax=Tetradesmus obliquus TaxID=3088 RepID=A0A383VH10_TETOB
MAPSRAYVAVLLCIAVVQFPDSQVAAQFLATTCPKVAPARCPGLCANTRALARREQGTGYCTGAQCSRIFAEASTAAAANGQTTQLQPSQDAPAAAEVPWWQQQRLQEAPAGADGGVPQRVLPSQYAYADEPQETPEQQAAIIQRLQDMMDANNSSACDANQGACSADSSSTATPSSNKEQQQQQQLPVTRQAASSPSSAAVDKPGSAYTGPDSQVTRKLTFISNSRIKLGLDMDRAGAISWLSSPVAPGFWRDRNLINVWDQGRLLQQSFYGGCC